MFDHHHYVPITLIKLGERQALSLLDDGTKARMTPLFVPPPIPLSFDEDKPPKSIDEVIAQIPTTLAGSWGTRPAFIDPLFLGDELTANGEQPLSQMTSAADDLGLTLIPTVSPSRHPGYIAAAAAIASDGRGICFRLTPDECTPAHITSLLTLVNRSPSNIDVVIDFASALPACTGTEVTIARALLAQLVHIDEWRSLTVAGSSFPSPLSPTDADVPRIEWRLHRSLAAELTSTLTRIPTYGDYVVAHPDPFLDVDPRFLTIKVSLKYTSNDDHILIKRGGLFKASQGRGIGAAAVPAAAVSLARDSRFTTGHCGFEDWTGQVAATVTGGGNPVTWMKWATLHHLLRVTQHLATLYGTATPRVPPS